MNSTGRYAFYYVPEASDELWSLGCEWLGRDPEHEARESGGELANGSVHDRVRGVSAARWETIAAAPRRYGFHATLKPPMRLIESVTPEALVESATVWAKRQDRFQVELACATLGRFIALRPADTLSSRSLVDFAARCVREFDPFRASPTAAELERRRRAPLTARQDALLTEWGYPYVFDEFRFHMTLSGSIDDDAERAEVAKAASAWFAARLGSPVQVNQIGLFYEPVSGADFRLIHRIELGG